MRQSERHAALLSCGAIELYSLTPEQLLDRSCDSFRHVVTVNAEIFVYAHMHPKLERILQGTINTIDGRILQALCKLIYPGHSVIRINGANFMPDLAKHCAVNSQKLFLLGSSPHANGLAMEALRREFAGLNVSGFSPPFCSYPFESGWNAAILTELEKFRPDHLVVCFGPIKQEYWIHENSARLAAVGVRSAYGLGGTIDFVAGIKARVPKWMEMIGTEWLFRLICEPRARLVRTATMFKMPFYIARTKRRIRYLVLDPVKPVMSNRNVEPLMPL